jgi:hypothetical protein
MPSDRMPHLAPRPIRRFRLRSLSYGGHVAPRNDSRAVIPRACGGSSTPRLLGSIINRQPRHCEPPGRANARPMTGSSPRKGRMDCFAALAMTGERHTSAFPRHLSPGPCNSFRPKRRGRRERRVLAAPAVSRAKMHIENAHEHTGTVGASRRPCAMVLRLMPCSPRRRIRLVTVIGGSRFCAPGWVRNTSADLTPATGARTTRFCRTQQHRSSVAPADRSQTEVCPANPKRARRCRVHRISSQRV